MSKKTEEQKQRDPVSSRPPPRWVFAIVAAVTGFVGLRTLITGEMTVIDSSHGARTLSATQHYSVDGTKALIAGAAFLVTALGALIQAGPRFRYRGVVALFMALFGIATLVVIILQTT